MPSKPKMDFTLLTLEELIPIALTNWVRFNRILVRLTRKQVARLLEFELIAGERRPTFVKRMHQRLVRLRSMEESRFIDELVAKKGMLGHKDLAAYIPWLDWETK